MATFTDLFSNIGINPLGGGFIDVILALMIGLVALGVVVGIFWWFFAKRKNWNIKVEYKIPRDVREQEDGTISGTINKEWGRGYYNPRQGVVFIKRKGKKPIPMKPFDIKRYLSASGILTVIQVGIEDYRPVLDDSYLELVDDKTGEEAVLTKVKTDISGSKSWRNQFERDSKATYSIMSFLQQHGEKLMWGLIIMIILVGEAIVITRLQ